MSTGVRRCLPAEALLEVDFAAVAVDMAALQGQNLAEAHADKYSKMRDKRSRGSSALI